MPSGLPEARRIGDGLELDPPPRLRVARYARSYEPGVWLPPLLLRREPPTSPRPAALAQVAITPPELRDYAKLCV